MENNVLTNCRCFLGRKSVERELKKRDELLEESERKAKRLEEEYENLGLRNIICLNL